VAESRSRSSAVAAIFTIGYEGSDIRAFVETLLDAGVRTVADVRALPLSRKAGFSKSAFKQALEAEGLRYVHFRDLGDPKPGRDAARAGNYESFRTIYGRHLRTPSAQTALRALARIAQIDATCMVCFERDPITCHRTIVADALGGFTAVNLFVSLRRTHEFAPQFARRGSGKGTPATEQNVR
jgi:uncharacterized protein (DUF488 family)